MHHNEIVLILIGFHHKYEYNYIDYKPIYFSNVIANPLSTSLYVHSTDLLYALVSSIQDKHIDVDHPSKDSMDSL
jgi:hypothetical protein